MASWIQCFQYSCNLNIKDTLLAGRLPVAKSPVSVGPKDTYEMLLVFLFFCQGCFALADIFQRILMVADIRIFGNDAHETI